MSTIQSIRPEKNAKSHVTLTQKIPMRILFRYPPALQLYFLSYDPRIFSTEMKPSKCPAKEKNGVRNGEKRRREKAKSKSRGDSADIFAFCACPNFGKRSLAWGKEGYQVHHLRKAIWVVLTRYNGLTSFKGHFSAKFPGANGLIPFKIEQWQQSLAKNEIHDPITVRWSTS